MVSGGNRTDRSRAGRLAELQDATAPVERLRPKHGPAAMVVEPVPERRGQLFVRGDLVVD